MVVCVVDMIWSVMAMIWHRVWRNRMGVVTSWVEEEVKIGTDKFSLQPKLIVISLAILGEIFNQIFYFSTK